MTRSDRDVSLFLPGFDTDDQAVPDLFADTPATANVVGEVPTPAPDASAANNVATHVAWRPSRALTAPAPNFEWPSWDDSVLSDIEGQVTKFESNMAAIAALRRLSERASDLSRDERGVLLRYTGWGGIPASFNVGGRDASWRARANRLSELLDANEYESAKASVNNSHYTDPLVIHWIWSLMRRMGFAGGRIVEPSAGVGHFVGCMPRDIAARSRITAVELDVVSGRILKALYAPYGVDVRIAGFEATPIADDSVDLVISNVPFGNYPVSDNRNRRYSRASIHNWFVGRALDIVRPGGIVCFITSSYFLDEYEDSTRTHVASVADLVTAFRLPSGTFERIATTSVQADLVVLRKREGHGDATARWLDLGYVPESLRHPGCHEKYMRVNQWFVDHPANVLGLISMVSNGHQAAPTAVLDGDLSEALRSAIDKAPAAVFEPKVPPADPTRSLERGNARRRPRVCARAAT